MNNRGVSQRWVGFGPALVGLALLLTAGLASHWRGFERAREKVRNDEKLALELPRLAEEAKYITSHQCQACHPQQHASWHRTYHRTMTQVALPTNVLGAFDGSTVISHGLPYTVSREGAEFWAEMPDPDVMMYVVQGGKKLAREKIPRVRQRVVMATGSHHYQTYWVASPRYDRLLQTLPLVYLLRDRRWIPREAAFMQPPGDPAQFITQWNHHCIRCHSTGGNPGLNPRTGMLDTRVVELGISCEACHGPGEEHARRQRNPIARYRQHFSAQNDATIVNPARLDHQRSSQACGQCHGVYVMRDEFAMQSAYAGSLFRPGDDLHRTRYYIQHPAKEPSAQRAEELQKNPAFFHERWWEDGTILAGGREYTAMVTSGCYQRGELSCLSCHSMHESDPVDQLKPALTGNRSCTQCHREAQYHAELERHTFHRAGGHGSECMNCHMPHTTYALLGAIRSHQISSPDLEASARYGVPNACNLCHLDKTLAWSNRHLRERYGKKEVSLTDEQKSVSAALLWLLKGHAAQRVIVAWHFGWVQAHEASGADWLAPFQGELLADPYGVVRYVAQEGLRRLPGFESIRFDFLGGTGEVRRQTAEVIQRWQLGRRLPKGAGPQILMDGEGNLMRARIDALLAERDNRPVTIKE